jgi:hypothetical protein
VTRAQVTNAAIVLLPIPILLVLFLLDPTTHNLFPKCVFNSMTGLYCFGCGGQRALHDVLNGNLALALNHNALIVFMLPVLIYSWFKLVARQVNGFVLPDLYTRSSWIWALAISVVLFGVLRNLAIYPLIWLAP